MGVNSVASEGINYPSGLQRQIDEYLEKFTFADQSIAGQLQEAMRYSLLAGGKRIRPVLALATANALGVQTQTVLPFAAAVELIHTYSLIHDDLPAMDDDHLRRGKPTCHVKYGEALAILAGDALYAEAFHHYLKRQQGSAQTILVAASELAAATGVEGMVGGQAIDITADIAPGLEGLRQLHTLKTGRLIAVSICGVLTLVGSDSETKERFAIFAQELGVLYQIIDDILDVTGNDATIGKPAGSDKRHGKRTYVSEFGLTGAGQLAQQTYEAASQALLLAAGSSGHELQQITDFIMRRVR